MDDLSRVDQGKVCAKILKEDVQNSFSKHRLPILGKQIEDTEQALVDLAKKEAEFTRERLESNASLENLMKEALHYGDQVKEELPHVESVKRLQTDPRNLSQKQAYVDVVIELIDTYKDELYFGVEALDKLEKLDQAQDKELREAIEAEDNYRAAVVYKNASVEQLLGSIRRVKRFVRRNHGIQSKPYQSIKDSNFKKSKRKKKEEVTTPQASPTPTSAQPN